MNNNSNSFTFFREYFELISLLPLREQKDLIYAIVEYMFLDKEPVLNDKQQKIFINLKRPLNKSKNNSKKSKGNGAPIGNNNASKNKLKTNKKQTKNKLNEEQKTNTYMSMSMSMSNNYDSNYYVYVKEIIDYLNSKNNTHYKYTSNKTITLIKARLKENYTIDDFKKVIDNKSKEWLGTEFEIYLRPETLFGNKFEGYLNQNILTTQERKQIEEDKMWENLKKKVENERKNDDRTN